MFGQCARWFELIAKFNFKLVHGSGSDHGNADALSKCPGGEKNFPNDCSFCYDNDLVNELEFAENSSKVDMFANAKMLKFR